VKKLLLLQQSVAFQVREMTGGQVLPLVTVDAMVIVTLVPQQASNAEGVSKLQTEPQPTVLAGTPAKKKGGVVSTTVTICVQMRVLVQQSVAIHTLEMTGAAKQTPGLVKVPTTMLVAQQERLVLVGGSNVQGVLHSTILFGAQSKLTTVTA
jgi:hypothetical protein